MSPNMSSLQIQADLLSSSSIYTSMSFENSNGQIGA